MVIVPLSEIEALIDELSSASKQVVNSINVVATSLELLKSLVASEGNKRSGILFGK